ncbi:uncharacterized protein LOC110026352 isoform X2 [Phalaenopsis equestris]|uniref:uncharacterized protein LOC110026352 isoform X2 n=1 Tax=Phalaenopsis equestris TaxID=78828 RepID=UPI0009E4B1F4|nr:uncharacterized protein LOC110026352 isoform X2 [Phalaenopsis equestris]
MGKPEVLDIGISAAETAAVADAPCSFVAGIRRFSSVRCGIVLLLTIGVLISTIFWIVPMIRFRSGFVPDDAEAASAEIQAGFILQKPLSLLTMHIKRLEYDILEEIGVPNSKVSIISMQPTTSKKSTSVAFGVLPEPRHASISLPALSLLRSSLIELVLQQINLTLSPSIFGETFSFEVLKFPGGITVIPPQTSSIWERTNALFNFTVSNSIGHIQENMNELKEQLKLGLHLRPNENIYVQMTNVHGSTISPPVTLQASILSDYGSGSLLPKRLRQLADAIMGSHVQNLGLNHSVFGEVKSVVLTSYLNNSISSLDTSSPPPSPSPSPSPSSSPFEECPYNTGSLSPCSPTIDQDDFQPPCLFCKYLSRTLSHASDHRIDSKPAYFSNSAAPNQSPHKGYNSPRLIAQSAHTVFFDSTLPVQDRESIKDSASMLPDSLPVSSSSTYGIKAELHDGSLLILTAVTLACVSLAAVQ